MALDPRDPTVQALEADSQEALADPSRAGVLMRMLPRILGAEPQMNPVETTSGMPQTGMEGLADVNALAGQAPSGIGTDVRMGTKLGDIYQKRAALRQAGDIATGRQELARAEELNRVAIENSRREIDAIKAAQTGQTHQLAVANFARLSVQERTKALIDASEKHGQPGSREVVAYQRATLPYVGDPRLSDPVRGPAFVAELFRRGDEAAAAAAASGGAGPAYGEARGAFEERENKLRLDQDRARHEGVALTPPANVGPPGRPVPMATTPPGFPRVSPAEQAGRDVNRRAILEAELANEMTQPPSPERDRNIALLQRELATTPGGAPAGAGLSPKGQQEAARAAEEQRIKEAGTPEEFWRKSGMTKEQGDRALAAAEGVQSLAGLYPQLALRAKALEDRFGGATRLHTLVKGKVAELMNDPDYIQFNKLRLEIAVPTAKELGTNPTDRDIALQMQRIPTPEEGPAVFMSWFNDTMALVERKRSNIDRRIPPNNPLKEFTSKPIEYTPYAVTPPATPPAQSDYRRLWQK